jgi:hypothetical protein
MEIRESALIKVNDEAVGQTIIDSVLSPEESSLLKKNHPVSWEADEFIARDPGDSLVFIKDGQFKFWDSISGNISVLGSSPSEFVIGYEE